MLVPRPVLTRRALVEKTLLGFVLANVASWAPLASAGPGTLALVSTTTGLTTTTAGIVALVVLLVRAGDRSHDATTEPKRGVLARSMMDSALLSGRGDLGLQLTLLAESPSAFGQFDAEVDRGEGAGLAAMVHATRLPPQRVAIHWRAARAASGPVDSELAATGTVLRFAQRAAPELEIEIAARAELAWALLREQATGETTQLGSAHLWMADWLGVSSEIVADVTARSPIVASDDQRAQVYADPDRVLDAIAAEVEREHRPQIEARLAELLSECRRGLPAELADLALISRPA